MYPGAIMREPKAAPRFRAYLDRTKGALVLERSEWERLLGHEEELVEIDLSATPMGAILTAVDVVATFAERTEGDSIITIVRKDPADHPTELNLDKYQVLEDLARHLDVGEAVKHASTDADPPFLEFMHDYVFIVPLPKGEDHHLAELPARYAAILKQRPADA